MKKVVIIGAGFAGIMAAKQLKGMSDVHITIISEKDHFLFTPRLTELLNESIREKIVVKKLSDIFEGKALVLEEKATFVDFERKKVKTEKREIDYDYVVIAPGSVTNFFGNEQIRQNTIDYKDYAAMIRIKHKMREVVQKAASEDTTATFAVIGGGFTGVELIASLKEAAVKEAQSKGYDKQRMKFILIQGGPTILPALPEKPREAVEGYLKKAGIEIRTQTTVENVEGNSIITKHSGDIHANLIAWCAGISAQTIATKPDIKHEKNNCIAITQTGQVPLQDDAYVIGDAGLCIDENVPLPPTAQVAFQEGIAIGKNIRRKIRGKAQKPFKYNHKGTLIVLGSGYGVFTQGPLTLKGKLAWYLRDLIYRVRFWQLT